MSRPTIVAPRRPPPSTALAPLPSTRAEDAFIRGGQTDGPRAVQERFRGPAKRRTTVYLTVATHEALAAHCAGTGEDLSRVIDAAVAAHLATLSRSPR